MALVTYNRAASVSSTLQRVITENGYTTISDSPFLGSIVSALSAAITESLNTTYDIAENVDIGRATGQYLDRWGRFLNEPRDIPSYAKDLSLSNVYIELNPAVNAGTLTSDGNGIVIPAGTRLYNEESGNAVKTLDSVYIRADRSRCYCRVIAESSGSTYIPAGDLSAVSYYLSSVSNIIPSSARTHSLIAGNNTSISGGTEYATDSVYQYVLQQKAKSLGIFNDEKIQALLDLSSIVAVYIHKYTGGAIVYLDTILPELTDAVVADANAMIREWSPIGSTVTVVAALQRGLKLSLIIEPEKTASRSTVTADVVSYLVDEFNQCSMGTIVKFAELVSAAPDTVSGLTGIRLTGAVSNGRTLTAGYLPLSYNERLVVAESDISIT